jgi:Domain of unknown function (DUF6894)
MPRFYFDIRENSKFISDADGVECEDIEAAEREAALSAAEIGRETFRHVDDHDVSVEVRNEHGQRVLTVTVSIRVDRHVSMLEQQAS